MTRQNGVANSRISGLRNKSPNDRLKMLGDASGLSMEHLDGLRGSDTLPFSIADGMIENVVGKFELPLGIATNFQINGYDYLIPMAVEEPSVVAAASFMARITRENGGFKTGSTDPIMRAQIQILGLEDTDVAKRKLMDAKEEIIQLANSKDQMLLDLGGGCKDIEIHVFETSAIGVMVVLHLLVDVRDAMGANSVNTMAETVAPLLEKLTGGDVRLRILSNLADRRLVTASVEIAPGTLTTVDYDGSRIANGIVEAYALAEIDPYRAATHNKGIMNGIDPIVIATGNDWRAIEAGAHAYAARSGRYTSLSKWQINASGNLSGSIELPMALGLVGGATKTHPAAQASLKLLNVKSANELGEVIAAVGLAQNMAALRALSSEGIQRGHMALHARNLAIAAGAKDEAIETVAHEITASGVITADKAREVVASLQLRR